MRPAARDTLQMESVLVRPIVSNQTYVLLKKHKKSIKSEFQFFFALVLKIFDCKFVFLLLRSVSSFTVYLPTLLREKQRERGREMEREGERWDWHCLPAHITID